MMASKTLSATSRCHPLQILNDEEIRSASSILLRQIQEQDKITGTETKVHFKNISLHDPSKALLLPHLDAEAAGVPFDQRPFVPRCVDVLWSTDSERKVTESTISLDSQTIVGQTQLQKGQHGPNDRYVTLIQKLHRAG